MAVLPSGAFRAGLAELSAGERARFVADLSRARGWRARIDDGEDLVVRLAREDPDGERERRLLVLADAGRIPLPRRRRIPGDVDAVVTPGRGRPRGVPADVEVVDGDALYERTVHGVGAADRERLLREYLDGTVPAAEEDGGRRLRRLHALVGVVALLVVATAVAGVPGTPAGSGTQRAVDGGAATPTPFVGSSTNLSATTTATVAAPSPNVAPADAYPPGVDESGIVDADALLDAHEDALRGGYYRMVLTYSEFDERGRTGQRQQVAEVGPADRLRSSISSRGSGFGIADPVPRQELYAEGKTLYRRFPRFNGTLYRRDGGSLTPANVVVFGLPYLEDVLEVNSSRFVRTTVEDGVRLFVIEFTGDADPSTTDVNGRIAVDNRGLVHWLHRGYAANAETEYSASVTLRYEFDDVGVEEPPWLSRANAALGDDASAFVADDERRNETANATAAGETGARVDRAESPRSRAPVAGRIARYSRI